MIEKLRRFITRFTGEIAKGMIYQANVDAVGGGVCIRGVLH